MSIKKDVQKHVNKIAGKLLAEGLVPSQYSKAKAKKLTKNVVLPVFVHRMIDGFSPDIKKAMAKMKKKR
tara:strand:- start:235 stop:441 length:207 start_codon:yes stop_codon:yes gene_type:complete